MEFEVQEDKWSEARGGEIDRVRATPPFSITRPQTCSDHKLHFSNDNDLLRARYAYVLERRWKDLEAADLTSPNEVAILTGTSLVPGAEPDVSTGEYPYTKESPGGLVRLKFMARKLARADLAKEGAGWLSSDRAAFYLMIRSDNISHMFKNILRVCGFSPDFRSAGWTRVDCSELMEIKDCTLGENSIRRRFVKGRIQSALKREIEQAADELAVVH